MHLTKSLLVIFHSLLFMSLPIAAGAAGGDAGRGSQPPGKPFAAIELRLLSLQDQINALIGKVDSVEERIDAAEALIQQLKDQNNAMQATLDDLSDSDLIADMQAQIDNNLQLIQVLELETDTLEGELATKQNLIEGTCPDGSAVQEIRPDGTVVCEPVGSTGGGGSSGGYYLFKVNQGIFQFKTVSPNHFAEFKITCPTPNTLPSGPVMEYSHGFSLYRSKPFWNAISPTEIEHGWHLTLVNTWTVPRTITAGINCQIVDLHAL